MRWGFVIDLKRCYGCYSCQVACRAEHFTPPGVFFGRCIKIETGKYPSTVVRQPLPILCMQCKNPECLRVCPTKATTQREDGIVTVDPNLCIGCRYCMIACPYGARYIVPKWKSYFGDEKPPSPLEDGPNPLEKYAKEKWTEKHGENTVVKCDFCIDRLEKGLKPACVDACPAKARYIGDLEDPESEICRLIKSERGFPLNPEFGTEPSVYYLPPR